MSCKRLLLFQFEWYLGKDCSSRQLIPSVNCSQRGSSSGAFKSGRISTSILRTSIISSSVSESVLVAQGIEGMVTHSASSPAMAWHFPQLEQMSTQTRGHQNQNLVYYRKWKHSVDEELILGNYRWMLFQFEFLRLCRSYLVTKKFSSDKDHSVRNLECGLLSWSYVL